MMAGLLIGGKCQECGCTDDQACPDPQTFEPCFWANEAKTYCSVCALFAAAEMCGRPGRIIQLAEVQG